jgi:23S rRNA pseudouridine1911/1915/1917 synthase
MAEEIPLDIVYEDDDLAVINKPAGMMVHAGAGATDDTRNRGTLVNALLHRFGKLSGVGGELRPGIVHRLDKETSGLIVVAKNDVAHRTLGEAFSKRQVKKTYLALVHGWPKEKTGTISSAISRDSVRRIRMTTKGSGGRTAITHYKGERWIVSSWGKFALLKIRIDTGRTHQIRVHLASIGHPCLGDPLYGGRQTKAPKGAASSAETYAFERQALHAMALRISHPRTAAALEFTAPPPDDFAGFLAARNVAAGRQELVRWIELIETAFHPLRERMENGAVDSLKRLR